MEKSVKESEQPSQAVAHTPRVEASRQYENLQTSKEVNLQTGLQVKKKTGKEENLQTGLPANKQTSKPASRQTSKPANPQARLPVNLQTGNLVVIKKYSTYLTPECIRGLKRIAVESDRKDYEVLIEVVTQYLERQ